MSTTTLVEAPGPAAEPRRLLPISSTPPPKLESHPAALYLASLSTSAGRESMRWALATAAWLLGEDNPRVTPWHLIRYPHMTALRTLVTERYAPHTANRIMSAVRGVLRRAWILDMIDTESYQRALEVPRIRGERLPAGRALDEGEVHALFSACANASPVAVRDAALIAILLGCGLRRAEAAQLDLAHLDRTAATLRVLGKGNRERMNHLNAGARAALDAWLQLRGDRPGPLLCPVMRNGEIVYQRLRTETIRKAVERCAKKARIDHCSPHDLRRTFVTTLLEKGNDIAVTSRMAGHRNISTTSRYDRRGEAAERSAAATIHIPYQAPKPPGKPRIEP